MRTFTSQSITFVVWTVPLTVFVAVKVGGVSLAAWSWWWLLMPAVPVVGIFVERAGL